MSLEKSQSRTEAIDLLRGFIMILMALDHASAMIGRVHFSELWGVSFAGYPSFIWWLNRFVSHLCAPGFFFLMGMSVFLFAQNRQQANWTKGQIRAYFAKRGGIILLLMFFLEFPAWGLSFWFQAPSDTPEKMVMPGAETDFLIPTSVLYGLGMCMIIGGWLWQLKPWQLLSITIGSFALSWFYITGLNPTQTFSPLEHFVLVPGRSWGALVIYPIIPWLGVATFGMFWAQLLQTKPENFYKTSLITGLSFISLAVLLRFNDWANFNIDNNDDWISFFTLVKYPPSIVFALLTCGINLVLLFLFSAIAEKPWLKPIKVFGQTAMFYYIAHLYIYALIGYAFPNGCSLPVLYFCWILGLVLLYFICNQFLIFKQKKAANSLWKMI